MIDQESTFLNVGKELPYTVPNEFFDQLPDKTLTLAKERMERRRKNRRITRFFAVMTSAAAVLLLFLFAPERGLNPGNKLVAVLKGPSAVTMGKKALTKEQSKTTVMATNAVTVLKNEPSTIVPEAEKIEDILQGLSDEDLSQLTAMYSAEDLVEEPSQETININ